MQKKHYTRNYLTPSIMAIIAFLSVSAFGGNAEESPWHLSITAGRLDFEGDQAVYDTFLPAVHVGYDLTEKWTLEGVLSVAPDINQNFRNSYGKQISRLEESTGPGIDETYSIGFSVEGLYHFDRTKSFDPYLAIGGGMNLYADDFDSRNQPELSTGAGVMWHMNSQWALRFDGRVLVTGLPFLDSEFNSLVSAGITWTPSFCTSAKSAPIPVAAPVTPPEVPKSVPAVKEKGEIVKTYELHIEFAENSSEITAQYYGELDVIGKELRDQPETKASIEAHIDQRKNSTEKNAMKLTQKRAKAVSDYLSDKWKIRRSRMDATGFGFSKPKEKADLDNGNLANRRIEIYIHRRAGAEKK